MLPAIDGAENGWWKLLVSVVEDMARECSKCSLLEVNSEMFLFFTIYLTYIDIFLGPTYYSFDIKSCLVKFYLS